MIIKVGSRVTVDHPITCINPDKYFTVHELEYDPIHKSTRIRGENTCWFSVNMIIDEDDTE